MQSLALLEAILMPEWGYRYYAFNSKWDASESMGSMTNGSGDAFFVHFTAAGCFIKGFAHESKMSPYARIPESEWPGVIDTVPPQFLPSLSEPAFGVGETTFAIWRGPSDPQWQRGEIDFPPDAYGDGSADLLHLLDGHSKDYVEWAAEYYSTTIDADVVRRVYAHEPLTMALIARLNPEVVMEDLLEDITEIGYAPVADFPLRKKSPKN